MNKEKPKEHNKSKKWTKPKVIVFGKRQIKGGPLDGGREDDTYFS